MATGTIKRSAWNQFANMNTADNFTIALEAAYNNAGNYSLLNFASGTGSEGAVLFFKRREERSSFGIWMNGEGVKLVQRTASGVWKESPALNIWGGGGKALQSHMPQRFQADWRCVA